MNIYYNKMASLNRIQDFLNLEIGDKRLKDGKKRTNKNQYYYYEQSYYIIKLTQDKWMIAEDCRTTRMLLRLHCWRYGNDGYATTHVDETSKRWHQKFLNYENGLVCDHINRNRFDNRSENLRITTHQENMRNLTKRFNNTSGKQGVSRYTVKRYGLEYWRVTINDNNGKQIAKLFSIKKLGDAEAKRQAIAKRIELEALYDYEGE